MRIMTLMTHSVRLSPQTTNLIISLTIAISRPLQLAMTLIQSMFFTTDLMLSLLNNLLQIANSRLRSLALTRQLLQSFTLAARFLTLLIATLAKSENFSTHFSPLCFYLLDIVLDCAKSFVVVSHLV